MLPEIITILEKYQKVLSELRTVINEIQSIITSEISVKESDKLSNKNFKKNRKIKYYKLC